MFLAFGVLLGALASSFRSQPRPHKVQAAAVSRAELPELVRLRSPDVFTIRALGGDAETRDLGSAVRLAQGLLVTSWHVVRDARTIQVQDGVRWVPAAVAASQAGEDLCLLRVTLSTQFAGRMPIAGFQPGSVVLAVSSAEGLPSIVSQGIVSGIREVLGRQLLVFSAPISEGSSGGGVFDSSGALVGIIYGEITTGNGLSLAVPSDHVRALWLGAAAH